MLMEQLINSQKVKTDNLKFRTDLRDQVMDNRSVTQLMTVYKGRLLKKSSYQKLKLVLSTLVTIWLSNIYLAPAVPTCCQGTHRCRWQRASVEPAGSSRELWRGRLWPWAQLRCLCSSQYYAVVKIRIGTSVESTATDLAANFGCCRFRTMPDIVSKLLRAAI